MVNRVGLPLSLFPCDSFPIRMTRRSSKKPFGSRRFHLDIPPELQGKERQIREFLSTAGKPPVVPEGCVVITTMPRCVAQERWRRQLEAIRRARKFWADQKQIREQKQR